MCCAHPKFRHVKLIVQVVFKKKFAFLAIAIVSHILLVNLLASYTTILFSLKIAVFDLQPLLVSRVVIAKKILDFRHVSIKLSITQLSDSVNAQSSHF